MLRGNSTRVKKDFIREIWEKTIIKEVAFRIQRTVFREGERKRGGNLEQQTSGAFY